MAGSIAKSSHNKVHLLIVYNCAVMAKLKIPVIEIVISENILL